MKKLVLAITIAAMAIGGTAIADTYMDNVGIYFDEAATTVCMPDVGLGGINQIFPVYVVLNKMTSQTVMGFEFKLLTEGPLFLFGYDYADPDAINVLAPPTFFVGFPVPHPVTDRSFTLMTFNVMITSIAPTTYANGEANIYLTEMDFPSLSVPLPAYLTGEELIKPMYQATGTENNPVMTFVLEGMCPEGVAVDQTSWDSLKSLYR